MNIEPPSHRYYRAMHGRWRSPYALVGTDPAALRQSPMGWFDRVQARMLMVLPRWIGPFLMETTLDYQTSGTSGDVVHTTRISWGPFTLFRSLDRFTLHDDGRHVTIGGHQQLPPWFRRVPQAGDAHADDDGTSVTYDFPFFGGRLHQRTKIVPEGLRIVQECPWARAEFVLMRTHTGLEQPSPN